MEAKKHMGDHEKWSYNLAHAVLIYLVSLLLTLPAFMIIYPLVPELILPISGGIKVDHLLTFVVLVGIFIIVVRRLQLWVYGSLLVVMVGITVTSLVGEYGFVDLYRDYAAFIQDLYEQGSEANMAKGRLADFKDASLLRDAIQPMDPDVRNFAVKAATKNFEGFAADEQEQTLIQSLSIFKEINSRWKYVADPKGQEYIATAAESIEHLSGDCDDHAVLMAASILAIGGDVRLIRTKAHIYPELYVGDLRRMQRVEYLIRSKFFKEHLTNEPLFHHVDDNGDIWLNLDYTRKYPGGEIMDEEIIGIISDI